MDMADHFGRYERANGRLMTWKARWNQCLPAELKRDVIEVKEPWLMFKKRNPTTQRKSNHLWAATLYQGPFCTHCQVVPRLSSHAYSGAGDITAPISETRAGKLPQVISKTAAHGYSSYGNQIGLATTYVRGILPPRFRCCMELGAVVGAARKNVIRGETWSRWRDYLARW